MIKYILSIALVLAATASTPLEKKSNVPRRILSGVRAKDHLVSDETVTRWGGDAPRKTQSGFDDPISWTRIAHDDLSGSDRFGWSLAVSHDLIVVGARYADTKDVFIRSGAVYLYRTDGVFLKQIVPFDAEGLHNFGYSVALIDDLIIVGTPHDDNGGFDGGSVYLYNTDGNYIMEIIPDDIAPTNLFGYSVAALNDVIIVGSPGRDDNIKGGAYMYDKNGDLIKKLSYDGAANKLGTSVSITDRRIAVGAPGRVGETGSVSLYDSDGTLIKTLHAHDAPSSDDFGTAVVVSNKVIVVGATMDNEGKRAVYLYSINGNFLKKLVEPASDPWFGSRLAVSNDIIAVSTFDYPYSTGVPIGGPIYLYTTDGIFLKKLGSFAGSNDSDLGPIALLDDFIVVGAPQSHIIAKRGGAAYFSTLPSFSVPSPQNLFVIGNATFSAPQVNDNTHSLFVSHIINGADDVEVQLYNKNCMNAINITDAVYISDDHYDGLNFSYSINLNTSLINNSSMNVFEETDNGTSVEVCTEIITKLGYQPDGASSLEVSFKKINYFFKFDLTNVTFEVKETTTLEAEEIQNNTQAVDMGVSACLCNASTFECVATAPAINQNERAFICLTPSSGAEISNFAITLQNGKFSYVPIQYGTDQWKVVNEVLTDVEENESALRISAVLVKGLFDANSSTIDVSGNAFLRLSNGKKIQNRITFSSFELEFEIVGEEEESGGLWSILSSILAFFSC